jgi:hypothetical protein
MSKKDIEPAILECLSRVLAGLPIEYRGYDQVLKMVDLSVMRGTPQEIVVDIERILREEVSSKLVVCIFPVAFVATQ